MRASERERAWGQEHNISFLVVARAAALRRAERRRTRHHTTAPNSALAVILHFGFVNLYLKLHPHHAHGRSHTPTCIFYLQQYQIVRSHSHTYTTTGTVTRHTRHSTKDIQTLFKNKVTFFHFLIKITLATCTIVS